MSNEIIRAKKKIHELVSNYENLVISVGSTFISLYLVASLIVVLAFKSPFAWAFIIGVIGTWFGVIFLLKEYEAETREKTFWLHDEY